MKDENTHNAGYCAENSYDIGYKKPPVDTRFKPGTSGNPKGRPKKKKPDDFIDLMFQELQKRIPIEENGQRVKVTKREVVVKQIIKKALMGDKKCLEFIVRIEEARSSRLVSTVWQRFQRDSGKISI